VAALALALLLPASSEAYVACERTGTTLTITMNEREDSVRVARGGDRIDVVISLSDIFDDEERGFALPCVGGASRVTDTETIVIDEAPAVLGGRADIDLGGGSFAPGLTTEDDGTSEIEIHARMGGLFSSVVVHGSALPDHLHFGRNANGTRGANLNGGVETTPDVDLFLEGAEIVAAEGRGGSDRILASGASGFSGPLGGRSFAASGGDRRDVIIGARAGNILAGGAGRDRLVGSKRTDYLGGGEGGDVLLSGRSVDFVDARRDGRDRVDCGGGNDYSIFDGRDKVRSCGTVPKKRKGKRRFNKLFLRLFPAIILVNDVLEGYAAPVPDLPEPVAQAPVPPEIPDRRPASAE
jgi:Ca2+-binding RTX toxin-like protein